MRLPSPIPYPAIRAHGVIGDRRTAALVAGDGTLDWLCMPDYDGDVVFGALLDVRKGGYWRFGPTALTLGKQSYLGATAILITVWEMVAARLELTDFMAWPADQRPQPLQDQHVVLRRLRCVRGHARCCLQLVPACNFEEGEVDVDSPTLARLRAGSFRPQLWMSRPVLASDNALDAVFALHEGEECWTVLTLGDAAPQWSIERATTVLAETQSYWQQWTERLDHPLLHRIQPSARLVHLLTYAPTGSVVAAPTSSLPERIGGDWNADYRFTWIRDASLSLATLSRLGNTTDACRYLEWLCQLGSSAAAPLQVVYGVRGETKLTPHERQDLYGYRGSQPVRFGNHAFRQTQHDAMGFLIDGAYLYVQQGGTWRSEFSELIRRVAHYLADVWEQADNSIWELSERRKYLSGRVMSWVGLDRAVKLAPQLGQREEIERWRLTRDRIHAAVLEQGWSDRLSAFHQHVDADDLDAAALLIPIMGLLPAADPRVIATVERVAERLSCDGFVYRFDPERTPGFSQAALPLGEFEGAFLPCTFWLAAAYALMGRHKQAEEILHRAESCAASNGLFAEAVDPRTGSMRGNSPLLFSHSEYVRAVLALAHDQAIAPARTKRT